MAHSYGKDCLDSKQHRVCTKCIQYEKNKKHLDQLFPYYKDVEIKIEDGKRDRYAVKYDAYGIFAYGFGCEFNFDFIDEINTENEKRMLDIGLRFLVKRGNTLYEGDVIELGISTKNTNRSIYIVSDGKLEQLEKVDDNFVLPIKFSNYHLIYWDDLGIGAIIKWINVSKNNIDNIDSNRRIIWMNGINLDINNLVKEFSTSFSITKHALDLLWKHPDAKMFPVIQKFSYFTMTIPQYLPKKFEITCSWDYLLWQFIEKKCESDSFWSQTHLPYSYDSKSRITIVKDSLQNIIVPRVIEIIISYT